MSALGSGASRCPVRHTVAWCLMWSQHSRQSSTTQDEGPHTQPPETSQHASSSTTRQYMLTSCCRIRRPTTTYDTFEPTTQSSNPAPNPVADSRRGRERTGWRPCENARIFKYAKLEATFAIRAGTDQFAGGDILRVRVT